MSRLRIHHDVPGSQYIPAATGKECTSASGAETIAKTIKRVWAAKGYDVDVIVEPIPGGGGCQVRSNMINGVPPRRLATVPKRRAA